MSEQTIVMDFRKWRGDRETWNRAAAKHDFPVTVRKVGEPAPESAR